MMKPQQYSPWPRNKKIGYGSLPSIPEDFTDPKVEGWRGSVVVPSSKSFQEKDALVIWERSEPWLRRRIWRNVVLISVGIFFFFVGMNPMTVVQSSLNSEDGLGVVSLAVKYACMLLGSFLASSLIFKHGCKWTQAVSMWLYSLYVLANFYPAWYSLLPAAAISGVAATVMWTAQKVYFAKLAFLYSSIADIDVDRMQSRLFVLLTVFLKLSGSLGNLVSSIILDSRGYDDLMTSSRLTICGARYCNQDLDSGISGFESLGDGKDGGAVTNGSVNGLYAPGKSQVYLLVSFCTFCCLLGSAILLFVDPLTKMGLSEKPRYNKPVGKMVAEIFHEMKDARHLLLIPMALVMGGGDTFWAADFTKAFITCAIGIQFIGYVSFWNGLSGTFSSLLFGWFNKKKTRCFPFAFSTIIQMAMLTMMFYWRPNTDSYWQMSIFAIAWFLGSGIRMFIVPAFYAVLFSNNLEVAFSVYHIWMHGASTLVFAWSTLLCMTTKIYILLGLLAASFLGYLGVEILIGRQKKSEPTPENHIEIAT